MNAPHLNRALVLEGVVRSPDGAGGFTTTWTALGRLWAEVLPGSGSDTQGEERMLSAVPYRITVRAAPVGSDSRPRAGQRFREGTRLFLIQAVTERDPFGRYLTCFSREEVPK
ncbi:head-tail adaptor protein [Rhodobacter calidifons]|uniref:Head-tail adaptor protein n=1 Tax=Rhodobacter calidifons TaxID=2715277 RepID=A0ABX0GAN8_9RHOB|nr:head-tail adaptor protein [Rhodobacter calidifons]NHB77953.1 head-tail adaptor protein [Rhodobacter calidifons]